MRVYLLVGLLLAASQTTFAQWTSVGTGIEYQKFRTSHPNDVYVARMLRSEASAYIESSIGQGKLSCCTETVSSQAARYDDAIGFWGQTWGNRNHVVIAINGSFYDTSTGVPACGQVQSGWYCKRYCDVGGQSGFAWTLNRGAFIGDCITHYPWKQLITYVSNGNTQQFEDINVAPSDGQITIFTPQYDTNTGTDNTVSEVLVRMSGPALLMPTPNMCTGVVVQIRQNAGSTQIPFDCVVLSAKGSAATAMLSYAHLGDTIGISQEMRSFLVDCATPVGLDWTKTYGAVAGNFVFLRNSVIQPTSNTGMIIRNPRTAIGYNANYVYFFVCDGRTTQSVGMTSDEMGAFFRDTLGATDAVNQDGGGSSTMVVNGTVMNHPSDGSQRAVSNGMMMCTVAPLSQSTALNPGDQVRTTASADVRLGPGTNYAVITTLAANVQGSVLTHSLGGVLAKGSNWWNCQVGTTTGWVSQNVLAPVSPTIPIITQQPVSQTIHADASAVFTVAASGFGLSYQWQIGTTNLSETSHYSGVTTPTLTVFHTRAGDAATYRCIVSNDTGNVPSSDVTLTIRPRADFDFDGDVDQIDFGHLQTCLSGPYIPQSSPACQDTRLDADSSVDADDFIIFQQCFSGPDLAADPDCGILP